MVAPIVKFTLPVGIAVAAVVVEGEYSAIDMLTGVIFVVLLWLAKKSQEIATRQATVVERLSHVPTKEECGASKLPALTEIERLRARVRQLEAEK